MTHPAVCATSEMRLRRSRCTGKERDTESGNDYFGARYYASSMGRWMSPDRINVTEDRMMNPSSTLNKYAYAADNPLKYVDPDGQDITIYYEAGNPYPGHTMLLAYNQDTGDSATRSFGPDHSSANTFETAVGIPVPGTDRFGFEDIKSPDDLRKNFTSYTIQTTPEEAQEVIDAIRAHPDGDYTTYWNNCTTSCSKLLRLIKQSASHALTPGSFFQDIWGQEHGGSGLSLAKLPSESENAIPGLVWASGGKGWRLNLRGRSSFTAPTICRRPQRWQIVHSSHAGSAMRSKNWMSAFQAARS